MGPHTEPAIYSIEVDGKWIEVDLRNDISATVAAPMVGALNNLEQMYMAWLTYNARRMTTKRLKKLLMGQGYSRNEANSIAEAARRWGMTNLRAAYEMGLYEISCGAKTAGGEQK